MSENKPSPLTPALLAEARALCTRYDRAMDVLIDVSVCEEARLEFDDSAHALASHALLLLPALVERELERQRATHDDIYG